MKERGKSLSFALRTFILLFQVLYVTKSPVISTVGPVFGIINSRIRYHVLSAGYSMTHNN